MSAITLDLSSLTDQSFETRSSSENVSALFDKIQSYESLVQFVTRMTPVTISTLRMCGKINRMNEAISKFGAIEPSTAEETEQVRRVIGNLNDIANGLFSLKDNTDLMLRYFNNTEPPPAGESFCQSWLKFLANLFERQGCVGGRCRRNPCPCLEQGFHETTQE